jgi:hypothetical protein
LVSRRHSEVTLSPIAVFLLTGEPGVGADICLLHVWTDIVSQFHCGSGSACGRTPNRSSCDLHLCAAHRSQARLERERQA